MAAHFDNQRIVLFGESVLYDPYYFDVSSEYGNDSYLSVVKRVLSQWAEALAEAESGEAVLYLPFGIYDQCTECFAATITGSQVEMRCVWLDIEGWSIDLRDLYEFMTSPKNVIEHCEENFGVYNKEELIRELAEAEPTRG